MPELSHVLLVGDFATINGGQAKVAIDSARLLADHGIPVTFFAACGPVAPQLEHPGIEVVCLDMPDILSDPDRLRAMRRGIWNRAAARRLSEQIRRFDPASTVLHCHGFAKALSPAIGPVLADCPMPVVYTMHEYFLACPNGGFYDFQKGTICTRKALGAACLSAHCDVRHPVHKAWRVVRQAVARGPGRLPRGLRDVVYISELQRQVMAPYLSADTRLHHLPNPVPEPAGPPVDARANDILLFVGRLNPEKGGRIFAEAAMQAGKRAVFVGDGAERAAIARINPEAEILGWQSPEEVQRWLGRARALVFPSLWYEGQPLVPIEALMRGVPVVCGTWSAARECVRDGENGILYDAPDAGTLAGALARVADLPAFDPAPLRRALGPKSHRDRLLALYRDLLAGSETEGRAA